MAESTGNGGKMKDDFIITEDGYKVTKKPYVEQFEERMREEARNAQREEKAKAEPKPQKNRKKAE